jgi:hypothetical protein
MTCTLCGRNRKQVGALVEVKLSSGKCALLCRECNADDPMRDARLKRVEERA